MNGNFIVERDTVADLIFFCANRAVYAMPLDITYANGVHMIVSNVHNGPTGHFDLEIIENGETTYQKTIGPNLYINTYYSGGPGNGLGFHRIERSGDYRFHTPEGDYLLSGSNPYIIALDNLILFSGVNNIGINVALSDYLPEIMNQSGYCAVYDITSVPGKGFKLKTYFINRSYPYRGSGYNERILYFMDYISYSTASGSSKSGDNFIRNTGEFPARDFSDSYTIQQNVSGNGTLQLPSIALPGDTVTLTATPDTHYALNTISAVNAEDDTPIDLLQSGEDEATGVKTYVFTMPEGNVIISAAFRQVISTIPITVTYQSPGGKTFQTRFNVYRDDSEE